MTHEIKREIVDVDEAVAQAGPPIVPLMTGRFSLRTVDPDGGDPAMLAAWFARPHLVEAWDQAWSAPQWAADSRYRLGGDYSRPIIVSYDGAEVAYLELYRVARDEIARLYRVDPFDSGLHIATADETLLGRGVMSGFMGELAEAVFDADPRCHRFASEPEYSNMRMRRALERQGFTDLGEFDIRPDRRIALYIRGRTPADVPTPYAPDTVASRT
ncbi:MAG TPA: GNAT family N-acetyltransferase [Gordonia sp. (in: high G+C Gram-positive bacteria)]|uniref:GNAT family N-acetyltransferase n=1 Tax=unclassified Gordonia (in: high G+C Gram-positive bacteria) TaxID=2657482 RepID=UPI000F9BAEDF|nr:MULTISPECIES: GNAT family N-acetyltransferase [unclassified Gordonia (in: high G+C Gram-positive bacteria)]RUP37228.1 MAG: N-acetyltransferase [Gordonia sp. (in: high G+C Gram-positive bacteria)]HNP56282.1 GNAT family N-acetyltransferase [Gordonia sp. (in: high G+C Gram-positive bacteria)]HRC51897.1 GNAT family N-acetyltransferase [Gordonia sp. (in: high G+C Gram-positive bacteria)]